MAPEKDKFRSHVAQGLPFHLDAHPFAWSNLQVIFKTPSGDNGCSFEGGLTVLAMGAAAEPTCSSSGCQVVIGNQEV